MALLCAMVACRADVHHDLDEREANDVVAVLAAHGIVGDKVRGGGDGWTVTVPSAQQGDAVSVLAALGLPRRFEEPTDDAAGGLVPSEAEERSRQARQLEARLEGTLGALDGVRDAHVHVTLPVLRERMGRRDVLGEARASVVIVHREEVAPPGDDVIRAILAGAVDELREDQVAVVRSAVPVPPAPVDEVVAFGPLAVSASSVGPLRALLVGASSLLLVMAVLLAGLAVRPRSSA